LQKGYASPRYNDEIVLFDGAGYGGQSTVIRGAEDRLGSVGFNDRAGSVQVLSGEWLFCKDAVFDGPCMVVLRDIRDLDDFGMDDEITSVRPLPREIRYDHGVVFERDDWSGQIRFFEPDGFGGLSRVEGYSETDNGYRNTDDRYDPYRQDGRMGGSGSYGRNDGNVQRATYAGPRNADLVIWEDSGFRGDGLGVDRDIASLKSNDFDDIASSLEIRSGKWEVCSDPYFTGRCMTFDANQTGLGLNGLNDNISSVRRVDRKSGSGSDRPDRNGDTNRNRDRDRKKERDREESYQKAMRDADVILFEHGKFKGRAVPVSVNMANLSITGLNDETSSIEIRKGSWEVCEHPDYGGKCAVITASTPSLGALRLNDNISSIRRK
jgi:hypothetical protein